MRRKLREWYSIKRAKNPSAIVLIFILLLNILFISFIWNRSITDNRKITDHNRSAAWKKTKIWDFLRRHILLSQ